MGARTEPQWETEHHGYVLRHNRMRAVAYNARTAPWVDGWHSTFPFKWEVRWPGDSKPSVLASGCAKTLRQAKACAEAVIFALAQKGGR